MRCSVITLILFSRTGYAFSGIRSMLTSVSYHHSRFYLAKLSNVVDDITSCSALHVVPPKYRQSAYQHSQGRHHYHSMAPRLFGGGKTGIYCQDLQNPSLQLPFTFQHNDNEKITIRFLEYHDVATVVPMCVSEFGTVPEYANGGFSWKNMNLRDMSDWFDSVIFGPLVRLSLQLKITRRIQGYDNTLINLSPDYAFLCLEVENQIAAIVELSIQPLDPERNPPPVPLPLVYKQAYSESKGLPPPNGWVCNLLVDQRFRGKGYSKILMTAVEGVAKQWGCTSISLHVDADTVTGRVAQRLYEQLGYKPVEFDSHTNLFAWMEPNVLQTGLYVVDGVPLLFLQKKLQG